MAQRQKLTGDSTPRQPRAASIEDARLLEQIRAGQSEVYGKLVEKYQDRVFNVCWRISGNLEDARDLTQDAFLKCFEKIGGFRQESGFYTWIFRIAVNLSLSHKRRSKVRDHASLDWQDSAAGTQAAALAKRMQDVQAESPSKAASETELQGKLVTAIQSLDHDHRSVIVLRDIEGFDYAEIGEILELPAGTVKSRLYRARMALREAISAHMKK